jgi:hypothetical protein
MKLEDFLNTPTDKHESVEFDLNNIGYSDKNVQDDVYGYTIYQEIPITGNISIIDLGGGYGNLYSYIQKQYKSLDVNYTNMEVHKPFYDVAIQHNINSVHIDFYDYFENLSSEVMYDLGISILSLNEAYENASLDIFIENVVPHFKKSILIINEPSIAITALNFHIDNYDILVEKLAAVHNEQNLFKIKFVRND